MSQGLQIFDATGRLILDIGSRPLKILTSATIVAGTNTSIPITAPVTGTIVGIPLLPETLDSPTITTSPTSVDITWVGDYGSGAGSILVMEF